MSSDYEQYELICDLLDLPCSPTDGIEAGNHKVMLALTQRLLRMEGYIKSISSLVDSHVKQSVELTETVNRLVALTNQFRRLK